VRIALALSSMGGGGAERVAATLANQWSDDGHDVTIVATFSGRGEVSYALNPMVGLEHLADHTETRLSRSPPGRLVQLRRTLTRLQPDIVLSFLTNVNVAAILAMKGSGIPVVVSERTYPPLYDPGRSWRILRRMFYSQADRVVMQTNRGLQWLNDHIPRARGVAIPNPVRFPIASTFPLRPPADVVPLGARVLLAVGRLSPEKQFHKLIDAFALSAPRLPDHHLVILGEGPERAALVQRARDTGLVDRIHFPGSAGNLDDWYRQASAFLSCSRFEGFPNSLTEAICYDLPVIAFDCPTGPAELVEDGSNGFLLPMTSTREAFATAIVDLVETPWPRNGWRSEDFRSKLRSEVIARQWIELFQSVLTNR
jgi:GalNAc-alpha-(1->4)-GalNAc-alpha-(1->3)-diNAcBac-PP-undecaprenol alpha-1,4-N-acetyl-D-galactosaminyltransferase